MTERMLLIDQGNTRLKWILARNGKLQEESAGRGGFESFSQIGRHGDLGALESILISSVAGSASVQELTHFCRSQWGVIVRRLESREEGAGVRNGYSEPGKLGVDRWLAIVGAVARHGKPVVIWDLGTATTLDAVDGAGRHIGGMIYPGPLTMLNSLERETELKAPDDLSGAGISPGRSTSACIGNGVVAAQVGALNQFLKSTADRLGEPPKLVVTGGAAGEVLPLLDFECIHDPWLVFRGMLEEGVR